MREAANAAPIAKDRVFISSPLQNPTTCLAMVLRSSRAVKRQNGPL